MPVVKVATASQIRVRYGTADGGVGEVVMSARPSLAG
jgi:hypothetical protein